MIKQMSIFQGYMTQNTTQNKKNLKNQGFLLPATGIEPVSNDFWKWLKYGIFLQTRINAIFFCALSH